MASTQQETPPPTPPPLPTTITTNPGRTTYVQADAATFRAVVQRLTGAPEGCAHKLPVTLPGRSSYKPHDCSSSKRQKLQERRRAPPTKLEIYRPPLHQYHMANRSYSKGEMGMVSPVSTMDGSLFLSSPSPTTPSNTTTAASSSLSTAEEEERAIAEKGFYLHPSPRSGAPPPQLLPLFPLRPPRETSLEG